jgi:hypothetical protein
MALQHRQRAETWLGHAETNLTAQDRARSAEDKKGHREMAQIEATMALTNAMLYLAEKLDQPSR